MSSTCSKPYVLFSVLKGQRALLQYMGFIYTDDDNFYSVYKLYSFGVAFDDSNDIITLEPVKQTWRIWAN